MNKKHLCWVIGLLFLVCSINVLGYGATGGTITYADGYTIHTFTSNGTFTPNSTLNVQVLIVAGGGGGGSSATSSGGGGGGGAGGLINSSYFINAAPITIIVGSSGAPGGAGLSQDGNNGTNSSFGTTIAAGGGGGDKTLGNGGSPGGSGGGGGFNSYTTPRLGGSGVAGQGNNGGATTNLTWAGGAGGGGAGGVGGVNLPGHVGGVGGAGLNNSINGTIVTYSRGGNGGQNSPAASPANTGKGGDAAYSAGTAYAGGSGIVIIRYLTNQLQCFFVQDTSCPGNSVKLVGVKNDSGGYNNAHVQNSTMNTYNYSLCCNSTNASITIGSSCTQATVIKLASDDNSHVEIGTNSNYAVPACLSSDWQKLSCAYEVGSCSLGACVLSMAGSEGINISNAHIGDCSMYSQKACCGLSNNAPTKPVLTLPDNGNVTVFERKPDFVWEASTDPEGDSILYSLNITCGSSCPANCAPVNVGSISTLSYTIFSSLCVDISYNWSVTACDNYLLCNTSDTWNFTIDSIALIDVIVNSTSFGSAAPGVSNDTIDFSPPPLVIRNIGNVLVNITINASQFFTSVSLGTANYQFSVADNETGSINTACSQTTFANMQATPTKAVCNLTYNDSNDEVRIHLNVTVPNDEPPGTKRSDIQFIPIQAESSS